MKLLLPQHLDINSVSTGLIGDVEDVARKVNEFRPLSAAVVKRIDGERVYSSNAIEGNTLDLRETVMILRQGIVGVKKKREATEARNLGEAARMITKWTDASQSYHSVENLLEIHRTILRELNEEWAGRFRKHRVLISGAVHQPPDWTKVPDLVAQVMDYLSHECDINTVVLASWAHWALARIHPFHDGNGRIARMWQDLILAQGRLTCAIIRPEDRRNYLDALGQADEGNLNPLIQLVAVRIAGVFDKYLAEIIADQESARFVNELTAEADERVEEKRKLKYERWSRRMEQIVFEFQICAAAVTESSTSVRIQVQRLDIIDQSTWENLRAGLLGGPTGFFRVEFIREGRFLRYWFFFGKHFWDHELDTTEERADNRVCLLISEQDGENEALRLDKLKDHPVTLREVFIVNESFNRKRFDREQSRCVYDRDVSPNAIAQDFVREVVLGRLT